MADPSGALSHCPLGAISSVPSCPQGDLGAADLSLLLACGLFVMGALVMLPWETLKALGDK